MGRARKWAVGTGFALIVLIAGSIIFAVHSSERDAAEDVLINSSNDRVRFAEVFERSIRRDYDPNAELFTEGEWNEGLVLSPCTDASLRHLLASDDIRNGLAKYVFRWIRCKGGSPVHGEGRWLR